MTNLPGNKRYSRVLTTVLEMLTLTLLLYSKYSQSFQPVVVAGTANLSVERCALISHSGNPPLESLITRLDMSNSESNNISIPFDGSEDRFYRWRFFQDFLDGDHLSSDVVNIVLYRVLDGVLKYPRPSGGGDTLGSDGIIEIKEEVREKIREILADSIEGRVKAVVTMSNDDDDYEKAKKSSLAILEQLERILPDPADEEEDYKSLWDTIIQIHGRGAVKFNESQNPISWDWKVANIVSRVLLHYDFLTYGIIDAPL